MEEESNLVDKICNEQNFDELLLNIIKQRRNNGIKKILNSINANTNIDDKTKRQIYEEIFKYVNDINKNVKMNVREIYIYAVKTTIHWMNSNQKMKGRNNTMKSRVKIIIADDDKGVCELLEKYLKRYEDIEILGIANTDEEELNMIETLKPEIVITDLLRNHKYTGLDIIKKYYENKSGPEFLVISADEEREVINNGLEVAGYIKKPFMNYDVVYEKLVEIKKKLDDCSQ